MHRAFGLTRSCVACFRLFDEPKDGSDQHTSRSAAYGDDRATAPRRIHGNSGDNYQRNDRRTPERGNRLRNGGVLPRRRSFHSFR